MIKDILSIRRMLLIIKDLDQSELYLLAIRHMSYKDYFVYVVTIYSLLFDVGGANSQR